MPGAFELTWLGCEGVLVRSPSGSILIDGLYDPEEAAPFAIPDADSIEALRTARPPFDGVDVVLATHAHADHFDASAVASYLAASPGSVFVSSAQAVSAVEGIAGAALAGRLFALDVVDGVRQRLDFGGITVEGFGLSHGRVHYADVQHLGWVVTIDGKTVIHFGDGIIDEKSLRTAGLLEADIDVAVLPFWFLTYPFGRRFLEQKLRARRIFCMHIRVAEREQVVNEILSFAETAGLHATPLTEPLAHYSLDDDP